MERIFVSRCRVRQLDGKRDFWQMEAALESGCASESRRKLKVPKLNRFAVSSNRNKSAFTRLGVKSIITSGMLKNISLCTCPKSCRFLARSSNFSQRSSSLFPRKVSISVFNGYWLTNEQNILSNDSNKHTMCMLYTYIHVIHLS